MVYKRYNKGYQSNPLFSPPPKPNPDMKDAAESQALRLKSLAEHHYLRSEFRTALSLAKKARRLSPDLPGLTHLLAAIRTLLAPPLNPYRALHLPPSSPLSSARRRYRFLSFLLHPDRSPLPTHDAYHRVTHAWRLLSRKPTEPTLAQMQREALRLKADRNRPIKEEDTTLMPVEDWDFYEFDKDRSGRCFRKGQAWAVYDDDDDGMPRHYILVEEVVSATPFRLRMRWLYLQRNGEEELLLSEGKGSRLTCGTFKVAEETVDAESLTMFSHVLTCERMTHEVYRIYPMKGTVWALYGEVKLGARQTGKRCYDIAIMLTSYSELYGLSMAYLEKVEGFKTVFRRKEVGLHAVKRLEKGDFRSFSHQIPARKLTGDEGPDLPRECWELDPASLPANSLCV